MRTGGCGKNNDDSKRCGNFDLEKGWKIVWLWFSLSRSEKIAL